MDNGNILVVGLDGAIIHVLTGDGILFGAVWSPDGEWIAFSQTISVFRADIYTSRPDGSDRLQVTDTPDNEIVVEWGPDPD